ncbi:MAG: hypothetical protein JXM69_00240 [Anaerolineae bacterium]|nr:hypothetical protein [Anaerolineae bacterium]
MSIKPLSRVLLIAAILLGAATLSLLHVKKISLAQNGELVLTKTLNRSNNVVRVGEVLSFTIALTNTSDFTLTHVTLIDEYAHTVLGFAGAVPPPDTTSTGLLTWTNVASPPILPLQSITITLFFTAEHPQTAVVNFARAQDIIHTTGSLTQTAQTSRTQEVIGGAAPVVKFLSPPGSVPQAGLLLTFTHIITNDGAAIMTRLPLTDTYDPTFLQFHFAIPTPTIVSPGLLVWTDLTTFFGHIPPFGTVVVTTVFTATTQVLNTTNAASTEGALDEYNNDLAAGAAQVPITIIDDIPTPASNDDSDDQDHEDKTDRSTPVPTLTPTPAQEITTGNQIDSSYPLYLPETGWLQDRHLMGPFLGIILLLIGWHLVRRPKGP